MAAAEVSHGAFPIGAGAGAIRQLIPSLRDGGGRALRPTTVGSTVAGVAIRCATSLPAGG